MAGYLKRLFGFGSNDDTEQQSQQTTPEPIADNPVAKTKPLGIITGGEGVTATFPNVSQYIGAVPGNLDIANYMRNLAQQENERILQMRANVPMATLPADYYSTEPLPAIAGYTEGQMPIISSPYAQKYPFALADERKRSLMEASMIRQRQKMIQDQPVMFQAPETSWAYKRAMEENWLSDLNAIQQEISNTPNGVEKMKTYGTKEWNRVQEFNAKYTELANQGKQVATNLNEIARDEKASAIDRAKASRGLSDPTYLTENWGTLKTLASRVPYTDVLNKAADQLLQSPEVKAEAIKEIGRISGQGGDIVQWINSRESVPAQNIWNMADLIYKENKSTIQDLHPELTSTQQQDKVKGDLALMFAAKENVSTGTLSKPMNINIGGKEPSSYVNNYMGFMGDKGNFGSVKKSIEKSFSSGNSLNDTQKAMATEFANYTDDNGEQFMQVDLKEVVTPKTPITWQMFPGKQISFGDNEQTFTVQETYNLLKSQDPGAALRLEKSVKSGDLSWTDPLVATPTKIKGMLLRNNTDLDITYGDVMDWQANGMADTYLGMADHGVQTTYVLKKKTGKKYTMSGAPVPNTDPSATFTIRTPLNIAGGKMSIEDLFKANAKKSRELTGGNLN